MRIRPQIKFFGDKLRPVINANSLRATIFLDCLIQCINHICSAVTITHANGRTQLSKRIDNRQYPQALSIKKLISHKIHRPDIVNGFRSTPVFAQLCRDFALRRLVAKLQAFFTVQTINPLVVNLPAFTPQKRVDTTITVSDARRSNLLDLRL